MKDLTLALRHIRRNKALATINVLGLSIGISACLLIFLIANYELAFDRFQPNKHRIFRVYSEFQGEYHSTNRGVPTALAVAVKDLFTGIESSTNFHTAIFKVSVPEKHGRAKDVGNSDKTIIAAPDYFEVFDYYEWVAGNPRQSLSEPFKVVLTESRAKLYFGDAELSDVLGREVLYQDSLVVTVSGVVKDIKHKTDFDFTDFISFSTVEKSWLDGGLLQINTWNAVNSSSQFFVKLAPGVRPTEIEDQFTRLREFYQDKWDSWRPIGKLQALDDLHFNAQLGIFDSSRSVMDKSTLYVLIAAAGLLLLIAVINFINLETAQATTKAREVGVRKILGSSRLALVKRFLWQNLILCFVAVLFSICIVKLSVNELHTYIPPGLEFRLTDPIVILFLVLCLAGVTAMAGFYPAFVMSSYEPVLALKNSAYFNGSTRHSSFMRKALIVFQFSFSQVFLAGALVIALQLDYLVNKDLGFDPDAVVSVGTPEGGTPEQLSALRNRFAQMPEIEAFCMHRTEPISGVGLSQEMSFNNGREVLKNEVSIKIGDTSYLEVYRLKLLAGRNFLAIDSLEQYIINETYLHLLGFDDAEQVIDKWVGEKGLIVGVVNDFHTGSLHAAIRPTAIHYQAQNDAFGIRLHAPDNRVADLTGGLSKIEVAWKEVYPDEIFRYSFMSDTIKRYYENEQRTGKLAAGATAIALFISCLGLFGLSSFTVIQRTKEIGIRKVLGATWNSIMLMLSKEFLLLVAIAFVIAIPVAYNISAWWLQEFAYKIQLSIWIFLLTGFFSLTIALITITFRTAGAAKEDPVKSLRHE